MDVTQSIIVERSIKEALETIIPICESSPDKEVYSYALSTKMPLKDIESCLRQIWAKISPQEAKVREETWNTFSLHYVNL